MEALGAVAVSYERSTPVRITPPLNLLVGAQTGRHVKLAPGHDVGVQGYLAHKKTPTLLGPPLDPGHRPTVGSWGVGSI